MSSATLEQRPKAKASSGNGNWRAAFYRQCRAWHAYLSAFAFLALIFFASTGLVLNHPEWLSDHVAEIRDEVVVLPRHLVSAALAVEDAPATLAEVLAAHADVRGAYASGEILDGEALLRFEGPSGASDVLIVLESGRAEISARRAGVLAFMNDLHRGKNAGAVWRAAIDVAAVLLIALSLIGYVLFFSLRFRLGASLLLTASSLAAMAGLVWAFVP
jgi:hypothetical protein